MQVPHTGKNLKEEDKEIKVRVPTRVDLAGGTLDLWPLYCFFENSKTINFAINGFVEIKLKKLNKGFIIKKEGKFYEFDNLKKIRDSKFSIIYHSLSLFPKIKGLELEITKEPPEMSGLGGSSALLIALLKALFKISKIKVKNSHLISIGRDLEAKNMGYPTGTQDFYPPLYGGLICINYNLGKESFYKFKFSKNFNSFLILYNTKVKHHSGSQNFDVFKKVIEKKDGKPYKNLKEISKISKEMEKAILNNNLKKVGKLMKEEWERRVNLSHLFSHIEIDKAINVAKEKGAWGWKGCGAAGGGTVVILAPKDKIIKIKDGLNLLKGEVLPYNIIGKGIRFL